MKDHGTQNRGPLSGFSPLAGVSAGTAAVLFATVVLLLAWDRVAAQVSMAITVLVYVVITAVCGMAAAALFYVYLWLRHRVRHPETLARRQVIRAEVADAEAIASAEPAAIEPGRRGGDQLWDGSYRSGSNGLTARR